MSSAPTPSSTYSSPVFADPEATMSGGTPLIVAVSRAGRVDDYHVTVKLQLLQAYERVIFELQQQLFHYKMLVEDLLPRIEQAEQLRFNATPLNAASARLLGTMLNSRVSTAELRGHYEPED